MRRRTRACIGLSLRQEPKLGSGCLTDTQKGQHDEHGRQDQAHGRGSSRQGQGGHREGHRQRGPRGTWPRPSKPRPTSSRPGTALKTSPRTFWAIDLGDTGAAVDSPGQFSGQGIVGGLCFCGQFGTSPVGSLDPGPATHRQTVLTDIRGRAAGLSITRQQPCRASVRPLRDLRGRGARLPRVRHGVIRGRHSEATLEPADW